MLAMGRALVSQPKLLMLDEPSMGLSPIMMQKIMATISELKSPGTTILLVEQNAQAALSLADQGHVMEVGSIVLSGSGRTSSTTSRSARRTSAKTEPTQPATRGDAEARPRSPGCGPPVRAYRAHSAQPFRLLLLGILITASATCCIDIRRSIDVFWIQRNAAGSRARTPSAGCSSHGPPASGSPAAS